MRRALVLALAVGLVFTTGAAAHQAADPGAAYASVLADPIRTDADRERDAARHTAETLAFAQVKPGQKIADMIIGGGYFTRAFSAAVGPQGHVTAWQPDEFVGFQASYGEAVTAADALANVDGVSSPIGAPAFPAGLDLIFTAQNYHDLHLKPFAADTATKVNAAAFAALKPGGLYVIIDHYAVAGSGLEAADSLHRIDIESVKSEVEAAGFVLDGSSDLLANAADPRTALVFDPAIRGHTSQFMLRFKKPT
ncbi:methyltransferase [Brevundimonas sp. Leaf363]|uniref:class I SAM-dependent methyltransferase n=1 Tax=Brevundimonas sp. Leaf363 TaxID=1736353 RepID=UPI0006FC2506|nr:class I SAM-dependent methyltransferase [Brevundimonas sp. Leaf363]KQS56209.1 methyltransferase [Brevundimonas sp. Leaf363]